jgi:hypothetical protein
VYHEDYEFVHPIAELGRKTDTSILLVHHLNKIQNGDELDKVSGSTGLTGAVENVMILDRARGETKAELSIRPREDQEEDFDLEFDGQVQTWIVGDQPTPSTPEREEVWNVLRSADGAMRLKEIAKEVGKESNAVSNLLDGLKTTDQMPIEKVGRGKYEAV